MTESRGSKAALSRCAVATDAHKAATSDFKDPTRRAEAPKTPEVRRGWEQPRHPEPMGEGGHDQDGDTGAITGGVRAEARREEDRVGGDPGNAPAAAHSSMPTDRSKAATDRIAVRAEMWMDGGEWRLLVRAPEWVVGSFAQHGSRSSSRRVWLHNYGGGLGEYSFLLGTVEVQAPTLRERFARCLLRFPKRRYATC